MNRSVLTAVSLLSLLGCDTEPPPADRDAARDVRRDAAPEGGVPTDVDAGDAGSAMLEGGVPSLPPVGSSWIGVPEPDFGGALGNPIDADMPARPASWDGEVAGYYYVDPQTGADAGRTYGTPAAPRATIPSPIPAGSYVELHGRYDQGASSDEILVGGEGTAEAWIAGSAGPIWVVGLADDPPVMERVTRFRGSFLFIDGLEWTGDGAARFSTVGVADGISYSMLRNSTFQNLSANEQRNAIAISGASTHHLVFYRNTIENIGPGWQTSTFEPDNSGFGTFTYTEDIWVLNNLVRHTSGDGLIVGNVNTYGEDRATRIYIAGNEVYECHENAIDVKNARDVIISQNDMWGFQVNYTSSGGEAVILHATTDDANTERVWILMNRIHDSRSGIVVSPAENAYVIGNLIHDTNTAIFWQSTPGAIVHNAIDAYVTGIFVRNVGGALALTHNVLSNRLPDESGAEEYDLIFGSTMAGQETTEDFNVFWPEFRGQCSGRDRLASTTDELHMYTCGTGREVSGLIADPSYTDRMGSDFAPNSGAPTHDMGGTVEPGVYAQFEIDYGLDIRSDIEGRTRPAGAAWDIGPFELPGRR